MSVTRPDTAEAEEFLNKQGIAFTRLPNGDLRVDGGLDLTNLGLRHLPDLNCVVVMGNVDCRGNNLISTAGMPQRVSGQVLHDDAVIEDMLREQAEPEKIITIDTRRITLRNPRKIKI